MKILFVSGGTGPDYQCDAVYHGLRTLFGEDVVDVNPLPYMYQGYDTSVLYGRGFSLYALLPDLPIDRLDIDIKISAKYFDYVVFGSIQREYGLLPLVREHYPRNRIILIDGEDGPLYLPIAKQGVYFKRELHSVQPDVFPIHFAIPEEKLQEGTDKHTFMAPLDPMDRRTYVYNDEPSYYAMYRDSLFARTMKKAGWDCMRHYEIMACRSMPYFINLEWCPDTIMTRLPKKELLVAKTMLEYKEGELFRSSAGERIWSRLEDGVFQKLKSDLITTSLATYVIDTARSL